MEDANMWTALIGQLGFPIALVVYLLKRDKDRDKETSERERRLGERIDKLEDEHRVELVQMTNASTEAITKATQQSSRMCRSIESLVLVVQSRTCIAAGHPGPVSVEGSYQPTPSSVDIHGPTEPTGDTTRHSLPAYRKQ